MGVGKNIKNALEKANITVAQLSKETEIPASTIYSIINRDSNRVEADKVIKIADYLGCRPAELDPERYIKGWDVPAGTQIIADFGDGKETFVVDENGIAGKWEPSSSNEKQAALLQAFNQLNDSGQDKAIAYTEDIGKIPKYRKP